jgi:hypothetical protein
LKSTCIDAYHRCIVIPPSFLVYCKSVIFIHLCIWFHRELTKSPFCTIYNTMKTKKTLTIIVLLGFSLTAMGMGLGAGNAGILPGAEVKQEKTEKKEEEKKEEEKNKKEEEKDKKVKRVWTDEDLKKIKKERLNITEAPPVTDEKKETEKKEVLNPPKLIYNTTEGEKYDPTKTEKYWRERKKALVDKIKNNEKEIERLGKKLLELNLQRGGTYKYQDTAQLEKEIKDTAQMLENYKIGLERMKKELEALPDEARKAGAPPGWLRD